MLFKNAVNPTNIFVGICEQNKDNNENELCIGKMTKLTKQFENNVRIMKIDYTKAKGPTYARYYCSKLWRGEEYYLQIDSHVFFEKNWDQDLIKMINQIKSNPEESNKPVLSVFPPTQEQMNISGFPEMDNGTLKDNGIPIFLCGWSKNTNTPRRSNKQFGAAGFLFLESKFLYEVPFDPNLSHLFQGEEVLFSARLFTNGWDFYTPNKKICYHHYNRKNVSLYHKDNTISNECRLNAEKRCLFLLGIIEKKSVIDEFLRDYNKYSLVSFRSIYDYWMENGIDIKSKTIERWNDNAFPTSKYNGWWFRRDGYKKIKKF
jgi:hypothetical protein